MDRPKFQEYKEHEKNIQGRLVKNYEGRFFIETTPYRYKYVQIGLFIIITAAAILISYLIANDTIKTFADKDSDNMLRTMDLRFIIHEISLFYFAVVLCLFSCQRGLKYIFAGFKEVPEDYFQHNERFYSEYKKLKPLLMDIFINTIKLKKTEQKGEVRRNFIYAFDGKVYEEKCFFIYYRIWDIIYNFWIVAMLVVILLSLFLSINNPNYVSCFGVITFSAYCLLLYVIFPIARYLFNRFEETDIDKMNETEEGERP